MKQKRVEVYITFAYLTRSQIICGMKQVLLTLEEPVDGMWMACGITNNNVTQTLLFPHTYK
jgi:hypothetical protein